MNTELTTAKPHILGFEAAATPLVARFTDTPKPQTVVGFFSMAYPATDPHLVEPGGYPSAWLEDAATQHRTVTVAAIVNANGYVVPVTAFDTFIEVCHLMKPADEPKTPLNMPTKRGNNRARK
ncbi:hypothetical protein [Corynebacterium diphtheriae]|uniref:hypothetical protein n=1 Tax=Corynebacterium diphtheriae TaxID=1717 RepID=UPI0018C8F095|nr:hypothetical protein [Corynebacterium diphtheriae]MBG9306408.1 hypothetical protein [Corynebacterium diphtheriae bv. mitis]